MTEIKKYHVYGVGSAIVDMEHQVKDNFLQHAGLDKGCMMLSDAVQQAQLTAMLADAGQRFSGGSVANTLITVSGLGGDAFFSCRVADDENGRLFQEQITAAGVDSSLQTNGRRPAGTTATCLVMVTSDAERSMSTHLGVSEQLDTGDIIETAASNSSWVYLEGYLSSSESATAAAILAHSLGHRRGAMIAMSLSDYNVVTYCRPNLVAMIAGGVDLLFCNEQEALAWTDSSDIRLAGEQLLSIAKTCVITRGAKGCLGFDGQNWFEQAAVQADAVDTTGAGDIFAGAFLYSLATGGQYEAAAELATHAASLVVDHFGAQLLPDQYAILLG